MADVKISGLPASTTPLAGTEVLPIVQGGVTKQVSVANLTAGRTPSATQYTSTVSATAQRAIDCATADLNTIVANGSYSGYSTTNAPESTAAWVFLTVTSNGTDQIYQTCAIAGYVNGQTYKRFSANSGATWGSWVLISANTSGNIAFPSGNGIDFSATAGTGTSELLDDYEKGTWTPDQGPSLTVVGAFSSAGTYTKIGKFVFVSGSVIGATSIAVSAIGQICTNLPFVKTGPSVATGTAFENTLTSKSILTLGGTILYSLDAISGGTGIYFALSYETD